MVKLRKDIIEKWALLRKMNPAEVLAGYTVNENEITMNYQEMVDLCNQLNVPPSKLLEETTELDLDRGIKISRNGQTYKRTSERNGKKYYTYNHLVTTTAYPTLMPLRVELHCNDENDIVLNGGHDSTEIVYVTKGTVRMHWEYDNKIHQLDLNIGDSAYIQPGVSHSFMAVGNEDAELIAINW